MLEMKHIYFKYKSKKQNGKMVLEDVSMKFEQGKFYTIYGPSGVGKTTCLALLGGLDVPERGEVTLDGADIKKIGYNKLRQEKVSYVFQDFHLFPYMTAVENVEVGMPKKHYKNNEERRQKATEILHSLGLADADISRKITKLSGGQQQRTAIARALATGADYILADEPTGNLDRENTENIINIIKNLVELQNKCVIAVTHSEKVRQQSDISYELEEF